MKDLKRNSVEIKKLKRYLPSIVEVKNYEYGLYKIVEDLKELRGMIGVHDVSDVEWNELSECPKEWLCDVNSKLVDCLDDSTSNKKGIRYMGGSNPKYKNAFLIYVTINDVIHVYAVRKNEKGINSDKEVNKLKLTRPWLIEMVQREASKRNLEYFRNYRYTDDYAYDNASNYGESKEWELVDGEGGNELLIHKIIRAIKNDCYNFEGDKNSKVIGIYSSFESFEIRIKE